MELLNQLIETISYPHLLIGGMTLRLVVGMRQFNRRGLGGLQHFKNYFVGLITLFTEWVLKWTANGMLVWGLLLWLFG